MNDTTHHAGQLMDLSGLGITLDPNAPRIDPEEDTRRRIKAARTELWEATCPSDYKESDWNHPRMKPWREQIEHVKGWQAIPGAKGMLLCGPTGRGKTRSLWALMQRLQCEEARDVSYWDAIEWFARLSWYTNFGRDDASGFVRACASRAILVLDDVGQQAIERARENWAQSWFFSLLDQRLREKRHTIVTTNLTSNQLADMSNAATPQAIRGEPLVRRLLDLCEIVHFSTAQEREEIRKQAERERLKK